MKQMSKYHDDFYREKWMTDDQWECAKLLADLFYGFNHITGTIKKDWEGIKVAVDTGNWAATFDFDGLTRAVVMAHDRMIRVEIRPAGPHRIKLLLQKRHVREGKMRDRHPTLEDAVADIRSRLE